MIRPRIVEIVGSTDYEALNLTDSHVVGSGLTVNATVAGGRPYTLLSTGPGAVGGAGNFNIYDEVAGQYRMAINTSGDVGIGTVTPNGRLEVVGNGASVVMGDPNCGAGSNTVAIGFLSNAGLNCGNNFNLGASTTNKETVINRPTGGQISFREGNGPDQMRITPGGRVGIGTASPSAKLHVVDTSAGQTGVAGFSSGGIGVDGESFSGDGVVGSSGSGTGVLGASTGGVGVKGISDSGDIFIGEDGNFNLKFRVTNGGQVCAANVACASDSRLKRDVKALSYGLGELLRLHPVSLDGSGKTRL